MQVFYITEIVRAITICTRVFIMSLTAFVNIYND